MCTVILGVQVVKRSRVVAYHPPLRLYSSYIRCPGKETEGAFFWDNSGNSYSGSGITIHRMSVPK